MKTTAIEQEQQYTSEQEQQYISGEYYRKSIERSQENNISNCTVGAALEIEGSSERYSNLAELEKKLKFETLANQWKENTKFLSSIDSIVNDSSYKQIINMGEDAIPFILEDLSKTSSYWFYALKEISGEDPVDNKYRGQIDKMTEAWISWGRLKAYVQW